MTRRTIAFAFLSSLVLGAGACKSNLLEPAGPGILGQSGADDPAGDNRGITAPAVSDSVGNDNPAGDNGGAVGHGADDPVGDDHGGDRANGGQGRGGADDPANHE